MLLKGQIHFDNYYQWGKPKLEANQINFSNGQLVLSDHFSGDNRYALFAAIDSGIDKDKSSVSNFRLTKDLSFFYFQSLFKEGKCRSLAAGCWFDCVSQTLYLARELFGLIPLYYHHTPNQEVRFSTDIKDLLKSGISSDHNIRIDRQTVADFMTFRHDQGSAYSTRTFYQHIKSVPPGHMIAINREGVSVFDTIQFEPSKWQQEAVGQDGSVFRELLADSVKASIAGDKVLGSHLSGGLDSSSICSVTRYVAPDRLLHTFHYSTYHADDDQFSAEVANKIDSVHHVIKHAVEGLETLRFQTSLFGQPSGKLVSPMSQTAMMEAARNAGCKILMNGSDGDSIVGSGLEVIEKMFRAGEWAVVSDLLKKRVAHFSLADRYKNWDNLSFEDKYFIVEQNFLYNRLAKVTSPTRFITQYRALSRHFKSSPAYFLKRAIPGFFRKLAGNKAFADASILKQTLSSPAENTGNADIFTLANLTNGAASRQVLDGLADVYNVQAIRNNEQRFVMANHYGFINSSPFYDKDLFEFCLAVPEIEKFGDGRGRAHFRKAMQGILPDNLRKRSGKGTMGSLGRELTLGLYAESREMLENSVDIWNYVERARFDAAVDFLNTEGQPHEQYNRSTFQITRTIALALWFEWLRSEQIKFS